MRTGKTHQQIAMLAKSLNEGNSVFVAGIKDPKDYIERLFRDFNIVVQTIPHYVTKDTERVLEDVPPYRVWETKYEPLLTGYEFRNQEIKPLKGDLSEAIQHIIKLQEDVLDKMLNDNMMRIPAKYHGLKTDKDEFSKIR